MVAVAALDSPVPDAVIWDQARVEAEALGLTVGAYLGRRDDVLGPLRSPRMCCHVFAANPAS